MDPAPTVYETLSSGSPLQMVPMIRNILGGFLFSGDDIYKRVAVLSGGERTRLAVARMLLQPSNTLLLDEPTNHLDLDSKDVLLEALEDYGGTLVFVSHDRYFIDKLATKTIDIGGGEGVLHLGTYEELLWRKAHAAEVAATAAAAPPPRPPVAPARTKPVAAAPPPKADPQKERDERKRVLAESRKADRQRRALEARIADLEAQITDREQAIKDLEAAMASPGFFDDREAANASIARHQALMWEVGDLMHRWEQLQEQSQP
jgi:ATP-binding cassette subfamily F protein 3